MKTVNLTRDIVKAVQTVTAILVLTVMTSWADPAVSQIDPDAGTSAHQGASLAPTDALKIQ